MPNDKPFVPNFTYDIFVSYAHVDDLPDPQGVKWITEFQKYLTNAVKRYIGGHEIKVFFDAIELPPGQQVSVVLRHARESAIFVPVISESYVARTWTKDELEAFSSEAEQDRIFVVELLPPSVDYPDEIEQHKRTEFWFKDENSGAAPYIVTSRNESARYTKLLNEVAYHVARRLKDLRSERENGSGSVPIPVAQAPIESSSIAGKTVLLAAVTDDLVKESRQVRQYLESYGVVVLPKTPYPDDNAKFVELFEQDLKQAQLFVQLLSEVRSLELRGASDNGEMISRGQFQFHAARRAGLPLMQWLHPKTKPEDVEHFDKRLIDGSLDGSQLDARILQQFMKAIATKLSSPPPSPPKPIAADDEAKLPFIFITAGMEDHGDARELGKKFKDLGVATSVLRAEEKSETKLKEFEDKVQMADAVVFFYGRVSTEFIDQWLTEYFRKRVGSRRLEAVYMAPPKDKPDLDTSWPGLLEVGSRDSFTLEGVEMIVDKLKNQRRETR